MGRVTFAEKAWEDYLYWQSQDKKTIRKINRLIQSIERDGVLAGEGKPEKLKYREGKYSRHINEADRLVYSVGENGTEIVSCKGHYED